MIICMHVSPYSSLYFLLGKIFKQHVEEGRSDVPLLNLRLHDWWLVWTLDVLIMTISWIVMI